MEQNHDNSSSLPPKDPPKEENINTNHTTHSPVLESADKPDGETEKATDSEQVLEKQEFKAEEEKEKKEEEKEQEQQKELEETVETQPESPAPSLEKISEEIDQFLLTSQKNVDAKESTSLEIPNFIPAFLHLVEHKIEKYDTGETKWGQTIEDDSSLLECANRISRLMNHFIEYSRSHTQQEQEVEEKEMELSGLDFMINDISVIQQRVMSFLEDEFRTLMEEFRNPNKPDSKGKQQVADSLESEPPEETIPEFPGFAEETIANLNKIAKEMIASGYENECCHVYSLSRRHAFEDGMYKLLGYEKFSTDEVQRMQWEALEREIPTWINTWKECTSVWFPAERKLVDMVFGDETRTVLSLMGNIYRAIVIQLLNFGESIAMTKRAGEKLFKLLDMYETLRDAIAIMESLFPDEIMGEIKAETTSAKCRLGEAAVLIFCDLENSIKSETGRTPVAGGAVHPLTRYIMNYLRLACEYKDTLEEVFKEHSKIERADSTSRPRHESEESRAKSENKQKEDVSPFAAQLMRVMELLDSNLEGKAKLYKEVALSCIFMMNNGRYIVQKIKGSAEIYEVMGETWCRKRSTELRTYHKNYQVETWSKILSCLSPKGLSDHGKVQKPVLKERFKGFNAAFEEIHKTQSMWVVSDEQLQSELRVSISALVIPAYRSFLGRFSQYLDPGRQTEKYIKYQAEDIETYIDDLFDGNPHTRR
ncbi:hypothetical protein VNO80_13484 [Phaseolus coccineus]|uniref:Exocyst subunit Exo70 family protein n=1 Tax=Phaseolus coccineus TaxID=3886 RepID=A0AAN9R9Z1_PHACN